MRVQENKGWDGYREVQNWDADILDTPEDDDLDDERGVCVCVCVCWSGFIYTAGTKCPQKGNKD